MKANHLLSPRESHRPSRCQRQSLFQCVLLLILVGIFLASCSSAQSGESIAVVQAAYDRLNEGDVDGFLGYFSDDAVLINEDGIPVGPQAIRDELIDFVTHEYSAKISDLAADGNVVTFTMDIYFRDSSTATLIDFVDVVVDGKIIFDGRDMFRSALCEQDRSQPFCK
jgi:hypothetical protein